MKRKFAKDEEIKNRYLIRKNNSCYDESKYHIVTYLQKHESFIYSVHCDKMEYREHISTLKYI